MKKCNICGIQISHDTNTFICNDCNNNNKGFIDYKIQHTLVTFCFFIIGCIYFYGGFYATKHDLSLFENSLNWFLVDIVGLFLIYMYNFTPIGNFTRTDGVGPFFMIPIVTLCGIINLISPSFGMIFFNFPMLNFITGLTCIWTSISNIKSQNII